MTPMEWSKRFRLLAEAVKDKRVLYLATTATMTTMQERIWGKGQLSGGGKLTYKENYEVYGYKPPLPKKPSGKGKYGEPIKGGWHPTYLALKEQQGRRELPFEMSADLRQDWLGGVAPTPRELDPLICVIELEEKNFKKAEGLAKQKGEFLVLSSSERKEHLVNVEKTYRELVLNAA
jgi:hypothetical protein